MDSQGSLRPLCQIPSHCLHTGVGLDIPLVIAMAAITDHIEYRSLPPHLCALPSPSPSVGLPAYAAVSAAGGLYLLVWLPCARALGLAPGLSVVSALPSWLPFHLLPLATLPRFCVTCAAA